MVIFHGDITGNNSWDIDGFLVRCITFSSTIQSGNMIKDDILGMIALTMGPQKFLAVSLVYNLLHLIWLNLITTSLFSLTIIMVNKGNHPQMTVIQVCEIL